jgi:hypothetical protein
MELVELKDRSTEEDESISVRELLQELIDDEETDYEGAIVLITTPDGHLIFSIANMSRSTAFLTLGKASQEILNS